MFDEAQCLFLRLFLRKGPWFRLNTLSYSELSEPLVAAQELSDTAMAHCTSTDAEHCWQPLVMALAEALSVAELQQLIASLELLPQGKASGGSKGQMLQRLQAGLDQAQEPSQEVILLCILSGTERENWISCLASVTDRLADVRCGSSKACCKNKW